MNAAKRLAISFVNIQCDTGIRRGDGQKLILVFIANWFFGSDAKTIQCDKG